VVCWNCSRVAAQDPVIEHLDCYIDLCGAIMSGFSRFFPSRPPLVDPDNSAVRTAKKGVEDLPYENFG